MNISDCHMDEENYVAFLKVCDSIRTIFGIPQLESLKDIMNFASAAKNMAIIMKAEIEDYKKKIAENNETISYMGNKLQAAEAELKKCDTDEMVSRFLQWQLPIDFAPDGGISFTAGTHTQPIGTNLLTATQAKQMIEFMKNKG